MVSRRETRHALTDLSLLTRSRQHALEVCCRQASRLLTEASLLLGSLQLTGTIGLKLLTRLCVARLQGGRLLGQGRFLGITQSASNSFTAAAAAKRTSANRLVLDVGQQVFLQVPGSKFTNTVDYLVLVWVHVVLDAAQTGLSTLTGKRRSLLHVGACQGCGICRPCHISPHGRLLQVRRCQACCTTSSLLRVSIGLIEVRRGLTGGRLHSLVGQLVGLVEVRLGQGACVAVALTDQTASLPNRSSRCGSRVVLESLVDVRLRCANRTTGSCVIDGIFRHVHHWLVSACQLTSLVVRLGLKRVVSSNPGLSIRLIRLGSNSVSLADQTLRIVRIPGGYVRGCLTIRRDRRRRISLEQKVQNSHIKLSLDKTADSWHLG